MVRDKRKKVSHERRSFSKNEAGLEGNTERDTEEYTQGRMREKEIPKISNICQIRPPGDDIHPGPSHCFEKAVGPSAPPLLSSVSSRQGSYGVSIHTGKGPRSLRRNRWVALRKSAVKNQDSRKLNTYIFCLILCLVRRKVAFWTIE